MGTGLGYYQAITGACAQIAGVCAGFAWGHDGSTPLVVSGAIAACVAAYLLLVRRPATRPAAT